MNKDRWVHLSGIFFWKEHYDNNKYKNNWNNIKEKNFLKKSGRTKTGKKKHAAIKFQKFTTLKER